MSKKFIQSSFTDNFSLKAAENTKDLKYNLYATEKNRHIKKELLNLFPCFSHSSTETRLCFSNTT